MSWVASLQILTPEGVWYTLSAVRPDRHGASWWLRERMSVLDQLGVRYRSTKIMHDNGRLQDPGQFAFLRGNEACAAEWQDGMWQ